MSLPYRNLVLLACALVLSACHREERRLAEPPPGGNAIRSIQQSDLRPGGGPPPPEQPFSYDTNAYAVAQGKQLFDQFNCSGCHAHGGGAIGPPLMDQEWIYGWRPENIFATIVEGRPNGMPAFGGKIPEQQVWQLVAYVRSLGGLVRKDVDPSRNDHLYTGKSEQSRPPEHPLPAKAP
jgi:cytochrome c oxidase cbb3-type subunit III